MKKMFFALALPGIAVSAGAVPVEISRDTMVADFDFRTDPVKVVSDLSDILPIAWNGATDWPIGGKGLPARISVSPMISETPEDVATWRSGMPSAFVVDVGEGVSVWQPLTRGLYKLSLWTGEATQTAFFDCSMTSDLTVGQSLAGFEIRPLTPDAEVSESGAEIQVEIRNDDGDVLMEGRDYILLYAGNDKVGTATAKAYGVGSYSGLVTVPFNVMPALSAAGDRAGVFLDTRTGNLSVGLRSLVGAIAWNTSETFPDEGYSPWLVGGDPDDAKTARISYAELSGPEADEPSSFTELLAAGGEGALDWTPRAGVWYQLKLEILRNGVATGRSFTRRIQFSPRGLIIMAR